MPPMINLDGKQFGDLKVIRLSDRRDKYGNPLWECECTCGNTTYVTGSSLRAGHYKSCGCKQPIKRDRGAAKHIAADRIDGTRKTALRQKLHKDNKSGHKGIMWMESRQCWRAYIGFRGKSISLGYFANKDDAIKARLLAEEKYHKPYLEDNNDDSKT